MSYAGSSALLERFAGRQPGPHGIPATWQEDPQLGMAHMTIGEKAAPDAYVNVLIVPGLFENRRSYTQLARRIVRSPEIRGVDIIEDPYKTICHEERTRHLAEILSKLSPSEFHILVSHSWGTSVYLEAMESLSSTPNIVGHIAITPAGIVQAHPTTGYLIGSAIKEAAASGAKRPGVQALRSDFAAARTCLQATFTHTSVTALGKLILDKDIADALVERAGREETIVITAQRDRYFRPDLVMQSIRNAEQTAAQNSAGPINDRGRQKLPVIRHVRLQETHCSVLSHPAIKAYAQILASRNSYRDH